MSIAREGYPFIFTAAILALLAFILGWKWPALIFAVVALAFLGFFRDPDRLPPKGDGLIVSAADGRVVAVTPLASGGTQVSVFLSPLDVHVNRSPIRGQVAGVQYKKGRFLAAYNDEASRSNEQNTVSLADREGRSLRVVQIAGVVARRIVCYVKEGDTLDLGQRFGLIMFGSRVDLVIPSGSIVQIAEGQRVRGGETIVGRFA